MKGKKFTLAIIAMVLSLIMLAGCSAPAGPGAAEGEGDVKRISIATAGTGGAWYSIAGAFANVITEKAPGMTVTAETSAAGYESLRKMKSGEVEIGILNGDIALEAYTGTGDFEGNKMDTMGSLFGMSPFKYHIVTLKDSGITSMQDIVGKRVGVGAAGSGNEKTVKLLLSYYGMNYDNIEEQFLSTTESVTAIRDGNLDVFLAGMSTPSGTIMDIASTHDIHLVPLEGPEFETFTSENPIYFPAVMPAGTYEGVDVDTNTMSTVSFLAANFELSEDDVYQLLKALWENRDTWVKVHAEAEPITLENALNGITIPLHPGAYKYYTEVGLDIPEELIPPTK